MRLERAGADRVIKLQSHGAPRGSGLQRAGRVVEELVDGERPRDELLLEGIIDDALERGTARLDAEADPRRHLRPRLYALLGAFDQHAEDFAHDIRPLLRERLAHD